MKKIIYTLFISFSSVVFATTVNAQVSCPGYTSYHLRGWQVLVESAAIRDHRLEMPAILSAMEQSLENILSYHLAPDIVDTLQHIPIFMDWALDSGAAVYHPNLHWILDHDYPVQKYKSVNITNMMHFYRWTRSNNPGMVLHEMAHGYYFRKLSGNALGKEVANAYSRVAGSGIYNNVLHITDSVNGKYARHYALTNKEEFFAEVSEAFVSEYNDFFPFDKTDLQDYDPETYNLLNRIWLFEGKPAYPSQKTISRNGWKVWADSEGSEEATAYTAIDGKHATGYYRKWPAGVQIQKAHRYIIDAGKPRAISGLSLLPMKTSSSGGSKLFYTVFASDDKIDWGFPLASGTWNSDDSEKTMKFLPVTARYIKLTVRSGYSNAGFSAAEINLTEPKDASAGSSSTAGKNKQLN